MPKIVCIDDTASVRALVRTVLSADGIDVVSAANGAEGLDLIAREKPDAILLDIHMPGVSGLEALKQISESTELARTPVMMLTSDSEAAEVTDALALGALDFVVKPFDHHLLRQRVRRLLDLGARLASIAAEREPGRYQELPEELAVARSVLAVDDQPGIRDILRHVLGDYYDVRTARTGAGALAAALRERPDLILMDIYMPVLDGVEALRRLRGTPQIADIKVVAMVLGVPAEEPVLPEFDGVVHKPPEPNEILTVVGALIGLPSLFSFSARGPATILRLHRNKLWDTARVDDLYGQVDRAISWMLESRRAWFVFDLEPLAELDDRQAAAAAAVVREVARRVHGAGLQGRVVVPHRLLRHFARFRQEYGIEVSRSVEEAIRSLQWQAERRLGKR